VISFLCLLFAAPFALFHLAMLAGLLLEARRERRFERGGPALVSLVVPARNEESRILPLFESIRALAYPNLELVFVDDRSTDRTAEMIDGFLASLPDVRSRFLRLTENPGPNFKQHALGKGIEAAAGELLLFTDADCSFGSDWVDAMRAALSDPRNGLAIGPVFKPAAAGFFGFFQAFDHAVRYSYLAATAGLGVPCGGFGNNLIVRRAALDAIGGYGSVPFSPTEDAALIGRIRSRSRYRVRGLLSPASRVFTTAEPHFRELARQGLRWNNGGLFAPDLFTRVGFNYLMLVIAAGSIALPLVPFFPGLGFLSAAAWWAISADSIAAASFSRGALPRPSLRWLPHWFLMPPYFGLLTLLGYFGIEVTWKGEAIAGADAQGAEKGTGKGS